MRYDAVLLVSFGGPEGMDDVIPFLENVLRGRNVPRERLLAVAEHYYHFGGKSPINDHCRELLAALRAEVTVPVYWGNRNWHPMLADTVSQMAADGVQRAVAIATSAYSSYSGCRQYLENLAAAIGDRGIVIEKIPPYAEHPLFVEANADRVRCALERAPGARLVFTAHSIPQSMAATCRYEEQLRFVAGGVSASVGYSAWDLVWQSRSGPPSQPWLEPDVLDHMRALSARGIQEVVVAPIGFLSDHMEVLYDLDVEAAHLATELEMKLVRAQTVGVHPKLVRLLKELVEGEVRACDPGCCPAMRRG